MKKIYVLIVLLLLATLTGCSRQAAVPPTDDKLAVVATVYPVYEFAKQVGGERASVELLVPPGAEPHDWEPKAHDLLKVGSAKLFLYHGAGLEGWLDKFLVPEVLQQAVPADISKGIPLMKTGDAPDEMEIDPHVWLDPQLAQIEVDNVLAAFIQADAANAEYYRKNATRYKAELAKLDAEYRKALATVPQRDFITTHNAFGYLAKRYQLVQRPIMGLAPDAEPTPARIAAAVDFCRREKVHYVFFEILVSPKLAETIAGETGIQALPLDPLEGLVAGESSRGSDYLSLMRRNLENLKIALND